MTEALEIAGVLTRFISGGRRCSGLKITPRHLRFAIVNDEELSKVFDGAILPSCGEGNHIPRKKIRQIRGEVEETSGEEEEVGGKRRKGVFQDSRANTKKRKDEVICLDSEEEDRLRSEHHVGQESPYEESKVQVAACLLTY